MVALSLWKVDCCRNFCYSNGWQTCHFGTQFVGDIFVTPTDDSLFIMKGSLLSRFYLFHWMVAFSLQKLVCCRDFCYSNGWQTCDFGTQFVGDIFVTPTDDSVFIMNGSLLSRFMLFHWMVALSLWKVVCCRDFGNSNGRQPCHYGRQSVDEIFFTPMDGCLVIMELGLLSIFLLLQWMVALSLWKVVRCRYFCYSNGWQPCHYGRQSVFEIFVIPMDGNLVIMEGSLSSRFLLP